MNPGHGWILWGEAAAGSGWSLSAALGVVLWSGLGILTVSLLVLMRTRWGQARPLSKCVALSVFAHVLLMGYAYGTRLFYEPPLEPADEAIQVRIVAAVPSAPPRQMAEDIPPWERPAAEQPVAPEPAELERRVPQPVQTDLLETELPAEERSADSPLPGAFESPPTDLLPLPEPERPRLEESAEAVTRIQRPGLPAHLPAPPPPEDTPEPVAERPPVPLPRPESLPRRETVERQSLQTQPVQEPRSEELVEFGGRLQQLAELAESGGPADALAATRDELLAANNRADGLEDGGDRSQDQPPAAPRIRPRETAGVVDGRSPIAAALSGPPPRRLGDGSPLPPLYRLRVAADRLPIARQFGGDEQTEAAVDRALMWLAAHQSADGRWDCDQLEGGQETRVAGHDRGGAGTEADTGITGLALLAFLAAGETHLEGTYRENVQRGLEFLLASQKPDGNLAGNARLFAAMYCHGMASLALSEADAMTGDHRLRPFVRRAAEYSIQAQHPTTGGWRYQPGDRGDMSQFGWQVMALHSAELAGVELPGKTRDGSVRFLGSVASGRHQGLASYRQGERASVTMTAEALACRSFLQLPRQAPAEQEAARFLLTQPPDRGQLNLYYCYYGTLAMFQIQGDAWQQWNAALRIALLRSQRTDGPHAGSWDPDTVWGRYGGRAYCTAMAALCLEVYYRYLPLYLRLQDSVAMP